MIKALLPALFLFASAAHAAKVSKSATNTLEIKKENNVVEFRLPEVAFKTLTQWNPEFVPFNLSDYGQSIIQMFKEINADLSPMAFIDDLDGNGKKDIVLLGADLKKQYVVALLQRDKKWTLIKVAEWSLTDIKNITIPVFTTSETAKASGTAKNTELSFPIYVLPAQGEHGEKLKAKKKVGIQVETYMADGDVYEIKDTKAVKFLLD